MSITKEFGGYDAPNLGPAKDALKAGNYQHAIGLLSTEQAFFPDDVNLNLLAADCFMRSGQPDNAMRFLEYIYDEDSAEITEKLGDAYAAMDLPQEAVRYYYMAAENALAGTGLVTKLADCLEATGRTEEAETVLSAHLAAFPSDYAAHLVYADLLDRLKDPKASLHYDTAKELRQMQDRQPKP